MPKKPKKKSDLTIVREGLDLSQSEFARRLGVSASIIKKVEEGKRAMSQDLITRVFAETGVLFANTTTPAPPITYTQEDQNAWVKETQFNQKSAAAAARVILKLIDLMLISAARPGVQKSYQVFNALIQSVEQVKREFHLEKHIEAELRERHSTETKVYKVAELRANDLLAKMVEFKDDPNLKDDETVTMTKSTGWLPAKEMFNIWWQHRELLTEILKTQEGELTAEATAKLEDAAAKIESALERELDAFLPPGGLRK
jgi:transcriptional regulator with XRE-family HTH domain